MAEAGSELAMMPGTMDSWDGDESLSKLTLSGKTDMTLMREDQGADDACTWKGASEKRVVSFVNNGGTTTLGFVTIRNGESLGGVPGGGVSIYSTLKVVVCRFIDNSAANQGGAVFVAAPSGSAFFEGCFFSGNSAIYNDNDSYNCGGTVTGITACLAGYASTQGSTLDDNIAGTHYSFSCTKCPTGKGKQSTTRSEQIEANTRIITQTRRRRQQQQQQQQQDHPLATRVARTARLEPLPQVGRPAPPAESGSSPPPLDPTSATSVSHPST